MQLKSGNISHLHLDQFAAIRKNRIFLIKFGTSIYPNLNQITKSVAIALNHLYLDLQWHYSKVI